MSKTKYIFVTYLLTFLITGLLVSYFLLRNYKSNQAKEIGSFILLNFQKKDVNNIKYIFADSNAIYNKISHDITKACPDSSIFKVFFEKEQSKTDGLWHFFNFIIKSTGIYIITSNSIKQKENIIFSKFAFNCSKKYDLTITFLRKNDGLKIINIYGLNDFASYLCPIFNGK